MKTKHMLLRLLVIMAVVASVFAISAAPVAALTAGTTVNTPNTAGSVATWVIGATTGGAGNNLVAGADTITITFPAGTTVPATISKLHITVGGTVLAVEPTVVGTAVTMVAPANVAALTAFSVTFSQLAGVANPVLAATIASATYIPTITTSKEVAINNAAFAVLATLARTPAVGGATTTVTVTGTGLNASSPVTVYSSADAAQNTAANDIVVATGTTTATGTFSLTYAAATTGFLWASDGTGLAAPTTVASMPAFTLRPSVTLNPTSGAPGTIVTVSGSNFPGANIPLAAGVTVAGQAAILTTAAGVALTVAPPTVAGAVTFQFRVPATVAGGKTVLVTDVGGVAASQASSTFTVSSISVTASQLTGLVAVVAAGGLTAAGTIPLATGVNVGGTAATLTTALNVALGAAPAISATGTITTYFRVPALATGDYTVVLTDSAGLQSTAPLTIAGRTLTISPTSGPRGTLATLTASTMTAGGEIDPNGVNVAVAGANGAATISGLALFAATQSTVIDTGGTIQAVTVTIPATSVAGAFTGANTVALTDNGGLAASGTFTVETPTIAISPAAGVMGTTVTVTGAGWNPDARGVVTLGGGLTAITAIPDASGAFSAAIAVPGNIGTAGTTVWFTAADTLGNAATAVAFTVSAAGIALSPTSGAPGAEVTVTGTGFQPSSPLTALTISGANMLAGQAITVTDSQGAFTATFNVPGLAAGAATVNATVIAARTAFFTVTAAPSTVAVALASIAGKYAKVWTFDAPTQSWQLSDVAAPSVSDLESLVRGQGYWIEATEDTSIIFSGNTYALVAGWNLIGWLG